MADIIEPVTARLKLRQWQAQDKNAFADLNADTEVMKYFPQRLSTEQSHALADKLQRLIEQQGWGIWAVEETELQQFIGFVGLHKPDKNIPCAPCVEIGWRLAKAFWHKGYATEAAMASLEVAFDQLHFKEIVSFTAITNQPSQALMQRLGMVNTEQNFKHPDVPEGHPLSEHVLYRITHEPHEQWRQCVI